MPYGSSLRIAVGGTCSNSVPPPSMNRMPDSDNRSAPCRERNGPRATSVATSSVGSSIGINWETSAPQRWHVRRPSNVSWWQAGQIFTPPV